MIERCVRHALLLLLCVFLLPMGVGAQAACQHLTATGNPEYPPYLWRDPHNPQQLIGANADLLKHLGKQLGLEVEVIYGGPWSRAQEEVRTGRIDLLAGYFLTQARTHLMDFISPAFLHTPSVVWVRQQGAFAYQQWSDLQGRKGGTPAWPWRRRWACRTSCRCWTRPCPAKACTWRCHINRPAISHSCAKR